MAQVVAVTGASGNVGRVLVPLLLRRGYGVRAIARTRARLASHVAAGATEMAGDLTDPAFVTRAFRGVDVVFAMIPEHPDAPDFRADKRRTAASLAEGIKASGVRRVVALSAVGVDPPSGIGPSMANGEFEHMLRKIPGLTVRALRAAFLMENHLASIPIVRSRGIVVSPVRRDVSFAMASALDVGAAAADAIADLDGDGYAVREVLGPRDYTYPEAAAILGAAIDRPDLSYVELPPGEFRRGLLDAGLPPGLADDLLEMFAAFNENRIQRLVTRTPSNTTATTLEQFAREIFAPAYRNG